MADSSFSTSLLLGAMDHLWFHHVILFSEPSSLKPLLSAAASKSLSSSSINSQTSSISEEETTFLDVNTSTTTEQDNQFDEREFKQETKPTETERERRPRRLNLIDCKSRSHSTSPSSQKRSKNLMRNNDRGGIRLQKTMSCKSLCELELEEVKGFMDLGFRFSKDHLSKRMMSLIPGLQRLEPFKIEDKNILKPEEVIAVVVDDDRTEDEKERCHIVRPYLSEAWLIKRPDSPLLNLRIPRVSTAADMKKHLMYWAKTVASAIQQES